MLRNLNQIIVCSLLSSTIIACGGSGGNDESEPMTQNNNPAMPNNPASDPTQNGVTVPTSSSVDPLIEGMIGPLGGSGLEGEYAQFNDSPFANLSFGSGYFYFEDFEDQLLEHPGASASDGDFTTQEFGPGFHDSVDADDGLIDGTSLNGESWFHRNSLEGIVWQFNRSELNGQLPTHVGIVWTDGKNATSFEAFGASGESIGIIQTNNADDSFNGETGEDRFFGVVHYAGVSAIKISNDNRLNGIEVDHLQWGFLSRE